MAEDILSLLKSTTSYVNELPLAEDLQFALDTSSSYRRTVSAIRRKITHNLSRLVLGQSETHTASSNQLDPEVIVEKSLEAIDSLLEKVDDSFDVHEGLKKPVSEPAVDASNLSDRYKRSFFQHLNIPKPQENFPDYPINNDASSEEESGILGNTVPRVDDDFAKLDSHLLELQQQNRKRVDRNAAWRHPYGKLLENLQTEAQQFKGSLDTVLYSSLVETNCSFVDSAEQLEDMVSKLQKATSVAVDIENHSYRSFQGFICLLQFSSREEDFIVDALKLRGRMKILASIFENENIIKVLHGANSDVKWLQRDFGLYIVNMFDTAQAAKTLGFPSRSLSYLLQRYCNIDNSKTKKYYQLADWRIRPLPDDMLRYAREDTHYLLYIYDRLCEELRHHSTPNENLLSVVYKKSIDISLLLYEKPRYDNFEYRSILSRRKLQMNENQKLVLKALCFWRDQTARREDESPAFVLPERTMIEISKNMPSSCIAELIACCGRHLPPLLEKHANEVLSLITETLKNQQVSEEILLLKKDKIHKQQVSIQTPEIEIVSRNEQMPRRESFAVSPVTFSYHSTVFSGNVMDDTEKKEKRFKLVRNIRQKTVEWLESWLKKDEDIKNASKKEEIVTTNHEDAPYQEKDVTCDKMETAVDSEEDACVLVEDHPKVTQQKKRKRKQRKSQLEPKADLSQFIRNVSEQVNSSEQRNLLVSKAEDQEKRLKQSEMNSSSSQGVGKHRHFSSVHLKSGNRSATF
eukprot:jgi/Galph1/4486/GphlegSOOS_G3129.1